MADERDPKVSKRYHELGSEEPPPALDRSILAAARNAAQKPHAPLVTPAGRHRWYFSLAAAAIVVLAVAVTWHIEREQPDQETVMAQVEIPRPREVAPLRKEQAAPESEARREVSPAQPAPGFTPDPVAKIQRAPAAPRDDVARAQPQTAPAAAAPSARMDSRGTMPSQSESRAAGRANSMEVEPPERWLERIIQLRKEGKQDDADKQLVEFRKRYPDYRVPEAALKPR